MRLRLITLFVAMGTLFSPAWTQESEGYNPIDILRSSAPSAEKVVACRKLKDTGTPSAVTALAGCLTDDALSHSARQALQCIPGPEAGAALLAALSKTSGMNRVGVIDSLGIRREPRAVRALTRLLSDRDETTATAAARSLGRIGTRKVVSPLEHNLSHADGAVNGAIIDALLRTADQLRKDGYAEKSARIARRLFQAKPLIPENNRIAAYRAWIFAEGCEDPLLLIEGLSGTDAAARQASLGLATEFPGKRVTKALADALKQTPPTVQIALLAALGQRGDTAACPAIIQEADSAEPEVRVAALNALGDAGDEAAVFVLAAMAASGEPSEQKAARQALGMLHYGNVHQAMFDLLAKTQSNTQIELINAFAVRRDKEAVPTLCALAEHGDENIQTAAVTALGSIGDESCAKSLLPLLVSAKADVLRTALEDAIVEIGLASTSRSALVTELLGTDAGSPAETRVAALNAAARIDASGALSALRCALRDVNPGVRKGTVRTLAQYGGPEAIGDLLAVARKSADAGDHAIALRGYWRLAELAKDRPPAERLETIRAGFAQARTPEDKKAGLSVLGDVATTDALECAQKACADEAVRAEAEMAASQIAKRIFFVERLAAERALRKLSAEAKGEQIRADLAAFLANLDAHADYVVSWLVSQPYRVEGKHATDLFDMPLGPELPDGGGVVWSRMAAPADPAMFWMVDLGNVAGGNQCVVYAKTEVFSERDGEVQLEIGSDDGIKLWVNGALAHANNAVRGFTAGQDKATATLKKGWNAFLAKITQESAGCSVAVRIHAPDGPDVQTVRAEAR